MVMMAPLEKLAGLVPNLPGATSILVWQVEAVAATGAEILGLVEGVGVVVQPPLVV